MDNSQKTMEKIVALCKTRGFVYPGSEIYGGLANSWDYGPLGVEYKNNIKKAWWKKFVQESKYNVGLDCAILMNKETWVASGHLKGFADPLMDCKACKTRHRADKLIEDYAQANGLDVNPAGWSNAELTAYIKEHAIACPNCGSHDFTEIRQFNLMFKTFQGVTEDSSSELYLRPETAQGIFVNFKNVARTTRRKMPFGIAQIGKSFRNEITPGNFIFRIREFEQMELEFFCRPGTDLEWFAYWKNYCAEFLYSLGMNRDCLRLRDHSSEELCFYSKATTDFEYRFPFGWGELWGIADRTDYDLTQHQNHSGESMEYLWAFAVGGGICVIGQLLISLTRLTPARILVIFVTTGVVLTALGVYEPLVDLAGAGATVPLTGFGYALGTGAMEGAMENGWLGAFTGGISATAGGVAAAILFGYLNALLFNPKTTK